MGEDPAGGNRLTKPNSGLTFSPPFPLPNLAAFGPPLMGYHGKTDGREVTRSGCILQTLFRQPCGAWTCNMAGAGGEQERQMKKDDCSIFMQAFTAAGTVVIRMEETKVLISGYILR